MDLILLNLIYYLIKLKEIQVFKTIKKVCNCNSNWDGYSFCGPLTPKFELFQEIIM